MYFLFLVRHLSIPLNIQHQVSNIENTQRDSSLLQSNNASSINSTYVKFKNKTFSKVHHILYNNSAGKNTMSKCQHTEQLTSKVRALLYYVHMTKYNQINCHCSHVLIIHFYSLIRFHTQRRICSSLSVRIYARKFCKKYR